MTAARHAAKITSVTATISVQASGSASPAVTGTTREQLRPAPVLSMNLNAALAGKRTGIGVIVTSTAAYLKISALAGMLGKPWIKVPLSGTGTGGSDLARLFRDVTFSDPVAQARLLLAVKDTRRVGTAVVDGVQTTEYSGSYTPSAAIADLPQSLRRQLAPQLKKTKGRASVQVWIDAQHQIRKITQTASVNGEKITTTITYTGFNQPVHIAVPPASQVQGLPAGSGLSL
jgi:hypothetical protein